MRRFSFSKLAVISLHVIVVMSMLLSSLPVEAAEPAQPVEDGGEEAVELAAASEARPGVTLSDPLEGADTRPVYSLEELAAMQAEPEPVSLSAEETAALLATFDLPDVNTEADGYALALAGRGQVLPGEALFLAYQVQGTTGKGLELVVNAPEGVTWIGAAGSFDETSGLLRLAVSEAQGLLFWQVAESAEGPFLFKAALVNTQDGTKLAQANLNLKEEGLTALSQAGGVARGLNQQVEVTFPTGAAAEELAVRVRRPLAGKMPPFALSGLAFEVTARGQDSQADLHQFARPLSITLHYDESQLPGDERFVQLYYFDETFQDWVALPGRVDIQNNTITAQSDHLTIFDVGVSDWQEARLPSLQPYQVAPFTGAAAFSLPFWTPPGPAGLAPSLELSYNSQASDNLSVNSTQASWVGLGWSLEAGGSIERNMRGDPENLNDDTYAISAAGVASELVVGTDGKYHTTDESFWRIEYNAGTDNWTAWDRLGTKYIFGDAAMVNNGYMDRTRARYPYDIGNTCDEPEGEDPIQSGQVHYGTWHWSLHTVTNIYGQTLTYSYYEDNQSMKLACSFPYQPGIPTDVAVYPSEITYPTGDYKVKFLIEDRTDFKSEWLNATSVRFFEQHRLQQVQVLKGTQVVRRYQFNYATTPVLFPSHLWSAGGPALTLLSVQEFGADGAYLPATSFEYDALHLTEVNNGYGGRVAFEYEAQPWHEALAPDSVLQVKRVYPKLDDPSTRKDDLCSYITTIVPPPPARPYDYYGTNMIGYNGGTADCNIEGYRGRLIVTGQAYLANTPGRFTQPGGAYRTQVTIKKITTLPIDVAQVGIKTNSQVLVAQTSSVSSQVAFNSYLTLPTNATQLNLYVNCSRKCEVLVPKLSWLAARYRVTKKSVYDGINAAPQEFHYRYDEPATQPLTVLDPPNPPTQDADLDYLDFRGHAATLEYGPDGRLNTTFFHQDLDLKGRSSLSIASQASFLDTFSNGTLNSSAWVGYNGGVPGVEYFKGDYALKLVGDATTRNVDRTGSAGGKAMLTQFMLSGASSSGAAGLISDAPGFRRWGVWFKSDNSIVVNYTDDTGYTMVPLPLAEDEGSMTWQRDKWYVLLFIIDDDEPSQIWIWERDNPAVMGRYAHTMPGGRDWRARFASTNATLWLDTYSEGSFYNLSETRYGVQASNTWPRLTWVYPTQETSYSFEGDGSWTGRRTGYAYGDYGNKTRQLEMAWNGAAWTDYRLSVTSFLVNTTPPKYLVGYPWTESVYICPAGSQNGDCLDDTLSNDRILQRSRNVYDGVVNAAPAIGVLTAKRMIYRWEWPVAFYLDEVYGYDSYGNRTSTTVFNSEGDYYTLASANPRTSTTIYDPIYHTYVLTQTNAMGQPTTFTYGDYSLGLPETMTGPNGPDTTVTVSYDPFGRPLTIIRPEDDEEEPTIQFTYTNYTTTLPLQPFHIQLSQKMDDGVYANFVRYYNGLGQVVQAQTVGAVLETGTFNIVSDTVYDAYGQAVQQFVPYTYTPTPPNSYSFQTTPNPLPYSTYTTYDALGRPETVTDPAGVSVQYTYKDLETRLTNGRGNTTRTLYDIWGRATQVVPLNGDDNNSPAGPAISYFYDDLDRLTTVWQGTTISTTLTYDFAGRKIAMNDPDMGVWTYGYDYLGNLMQQTDARGCVTSLSYDPLNRLTQKSFSGTCSGQAVTYSYDSILDGNYGIGQRTGMTDASGSASWKYDARGQLKLETKVISGSTFKTEWHYNSAGMMDWMRYPSNDNGGLGEQVMYSYLPQMALDSVYVGTLPGNPIYVQGTEYDSAGRVTLRTLGSANPVQTRYNYYPWNASVDGGKLQQIYTTRGTAVLQNFQYDYDSNSNITDILDYVMGNPQTQSFSYDNLDRLTSAGAANGTQGNYGPEGYSYDAATGNLANKNGAAYDYEAQSAVCPDGALDKAHAAVTAGDNFYCYDLNGNMVQRVISETNYITYTLSYDAENHMIDYNGGTVSASFLYDGDGRRVQSTVNGVTTQFVGSHVEWKSSTSDMVRYYYAGGVRVAMRTGEDGLVWLVGDHLGSTSIAVTDASGATERQGYRAWGETRFGSLPTKYRYTGQYEEPELGLYYYGARWYDSYLNRWAQPDSIIPDISNPVDWDRYAYVRNNPIKYIDPSGHNEDCAIGETECLEQVKAEEAYKAAMIEEYGEEYYQDIARQDYLFSLLFAGPVSGRSSWTAADWRYYFEKRKSLWNSPPGDETFPVLLLRLASHYSNAQKDQFVKDMALIFGGMPTASGTPAQAAWASRSGPPLPILNVTNRGLKDEYLDKHKAANQSHHYAGIFFLGYFFGASFATDINYLRDADNSGDILLGNRAASQGAGFRWSDISSLMYYIYELWSEE